MIVTPLEAEDKLCLQSVAHANAATPYCAGPECMAWRWDDEGNRVRAYDAQMSQAAKPERRGFCGLAYSVRLP